jgi:hypothetical protein
MAYRDSMPQRYSIIGDGLTFGMVFVRGKLCAKVNLGPLLLSRANWQRGTQVKIQWGIGDDHGKCRLVEGEPGYRLRPFGKSALSLGLLTTNLPPGAIADEHQPELCKVNVSKSKAVEFEIPKWFFRQFSQDAFA